MRGQPIDIKGAAKMIFTGSISQRAPYLRRLLTAVAASAPIVVCYLLVGCPFRYIAGIPCPGCGMTRAWICLSRGDIDGAFFFHPLWSFPLFFAAIYIWLRPKDRRLYDILVKVMLGLFVCVYIVRLAAHSPVVEIDIANGLIHRVLSYLLFS